MTALHLITPATAADLPALREWVQAWPGREARIKWAGKRWWIDLFAGDRIVAAVGHADPQVALGRALQMAAEGT